MPLMQKCAYVCASVWVPCFQPYTFPVRAMSRAVHSTLRARPRTERERERDVSRLRNSLQSQRSLEEYSTTEFSVHSLRDRDKVYTEQKTLCFSAPSHLCSESCESSVCKRDYFYSIGKHAALSVKHSLTLPLGKATGLSRDPSHGSGAEERINYYCCLCACAARFELSC